MIDKTRFCYYLEGLERPEPIFHLWMPESKGFSDVGGETLLTSGKPLPMFPDYRTWRREVASKKRCGRCWAVTRGHNDLIHHLQHHHLSAPIHMPEGIKSMEEIS